MTETKTYHHGDLRATLLTAARDMLAEHGYEALSLRALARDIGVASSAPYAHFGSREELLWALIDEGGQQLAALFGVIADAPGSATEKLGLAGRGYLAFAAAEPELMRLMYVSPLTTNQLPAAGARSIVIFEGLVADVMGSEDQVHVRDVAICCWSVMHGFAMLRLHNRLAPGIDALDAAKLVVEAAVRLAQTARASPNVPPDRR